MGGNIAGCHPMLVLVDLTDLLGRGAGAVERGGLENRCPSYGGPRVRIPPSPPWVLFAERSRVSRKVAPFGYRLVEDDPPIDDCLTATRGFGETPSVLCLEHNRDDNTPRDVAERRS